MIRALRAFISNHRWRRLFADLDAEDRRAREANDNRAIGRTRKARYARVHDGLRAASNWRGVH